MNSLLLQASCINLSYPSLVKLSRLKGIFSLNSLLKQVSLPRQFTSGYNKMDYQKGFSLVEVLISLMLISTLALCLLEQQWKMRAYVSSLNVHAGASDFLDKISEYLYVKSKALPEAPEPYHFQIEYQASSYALRIDWNHQSSFLSRRISGL